MQNWQENLFSIVEGSHDERALFDKIVAMAKSLGFERCAYVLRVPLSLSKPQAIAITNYPDTWLSRYTEAGYLETDPTILHGRRSQAPIVWTDDVFASTKRFWDEAQSFGLRVGWGQSSLDVNGVMGMLSLARSHDALSASELASHGPQLHWLASVAHLSLSQLFIPQLREHIDLTMREIEVLKWTADGKTSGEIAIILSVSVNTVNFHIKNAVAKLQTANKTAAVVRAAMLGLLN